MEISIVGWTSCCQRNAALAYVALAAGLTGATAANAQQGSPLQWSVTPYLWASNTTVDLRLRDQDLGSGELSFNDLLDITDQSFMINVEAGRGRWSAFADLTYLDTTDRDERTLLTVVTRSNQSFVDLGAAFWPRGVGSPLSVVGGIRATLFDDRYQFLFNDQLLGERRSNNDYVDVLLGVRYRFPLSDRWSLQTDGNVSFGDSEGTLMARAFLAYSIGGGDRYQVLFGYQYKEAEFKADDLRSDFVYGGPGAGFSFRF
jgi:hypothetical protein